MFKKKKKNQKDKVSLKFLKSDNGMLEWKSILCNFEKKSNISSFEQLSVFEVFSTAFQLIYSAAFIYKGVKKKLRQSGIIKNTEVMFNYLKLPILQGGTDY